MKLKRWLSLILSMAIMATLFSTPVAYAGEADALAGMQEELPDAEIVRMSGELLDSTVIADSNELPDNDKLFAEYVDQLFFGKSSISTYGNWADQKLTGIDLKAYHILKEWIHKIASGQEESCIITIPLEDLGLNQTSWTASELGLPTIYNAEGKLSQEAMDALNKKVMPNTRSLLNCLLVDCPWDLYWYDKMKGMLLGIAGIYTYPPLEKLEAGGILCQFTVAKDYQKADAKEPDYTVDSSLAHRAQTAADTAKGIVETYKDSDDYEKMTAYRKEICERVSYDQAAADDNATPYGDPWQLISVFDGDDSTNVVCEGYSKAFQYLCDLSQFKNPNVMCYTVTGDLDSPGRGHMWNIVTMWNKKNYIVDVTNCDEGAVGAADKLFLSGASGSIENGYTAAIGTKYIYDAMTKDMYGDMLRISETDYDPQDWKNHEHSFGAWVTKIEASCTEKGKRERICDLCGETESEEIPANSAVGHAFRKETKKATQKEDGYTLDVCTKCGQKGTPVAIYKIKTVSLGNSKYTYTGKKLTPAVTVKDKNGKISSSHYKVSYAKNKDVGTASVTITFSGNYEGKIEKTFQIIPKPVKISKLSRLSKGFKATWKKQAVQTTGYQIQYSTSSNFKNGKIITIKKNSTKSKTVKKLKAKKKYYVRIRTYKTINGKKIASNWSAAKKVVTKK